MPTNTQQRVLTDTVRMRGRTNTTTSTASKSSVVTGSKRIFPGPNKPRLNSHSTRVSSGTTSSTIANNIHEMHYPRPVKIITEVDDTNIDEVLGFSDLSMIPVSFLTEIQHDQIYETILEELRKKIPHSMPLKALPILEEEQEQQQQRKPFSPHLFAIGDDDDDDISITDEISSSSSSSSSSTSPTNEHTDLPTHDDYDTDIEPESAPVSKPDTTGREQYRELCEQKGVVPCSYFLAHIQDEKLILRYHQFNSEDIRAITKTLASNFRVETLYLDGNYLQEQSAKYIKELMLKNDFISELSLADNQLGGGQGTKEICAMISSNRHLKKINLSGNHFNELDVLQLVEAFEKNKTLLELDLSHNDFGEECGKSLGTFISSNEILRSIDLSWNNFHGRSAIDLINGIKENNHLKSCNLSMNGFGPSMGQVLADFIKQNNTLEELNIIGNRLNTISAFAIAQALLTNESLQVFKIADNQINSDGVLAIFLAIKANQENSLREVDFSPTVVTQETVDVCEDIVKLKNGNFKYSVGKTTHEKLQPNSTSECYPKTNEDLLKKLRSIAANVKADVS